MDLFPPTMENTVPPPVTATLSSVTATDSSADVTTQIVTDPITPLDTTTTIIEDDYRLNMFGPTMNPQQQTTGDNTNPRRPTTRFDTSLETGYDNIPTEEIFTSNSGDFAATSPTDLSSILTTTDTTILSVNTPKLVVSGETTSAASCITTADCTLNEKCISQRCLTKCNVNSSTNHVDCFKGTYK